MKDAALDARKTHFVAFRCSEADYRHLESSSNRNGLTLSETIRKTLSERLQRSGLDPKEPLPHEPVSP